MEGRTVWGLTMVCNVVDVRQLWDSERGCSVCEIYVLLCVAGMGMEVTD